MPQAFAKGPISSTSSNAQATLYGTPQTFDKLGGSYDFSLAYMPPSEFHPIIAHAKH
jgi:hypothetical protein